MIRINIGINIALYKTGIGEREMHTARLERNCVVYRLYVR